MALKRRDFLKASAAFATASAAGGFSCVELAGAAPVQPPVVDRLSVRVLVDGSYNLFLRPGEVQGVRIEPAPRTDYAAPCTTNGAFRCCWNRNGRTSSTLYCSILATRPKRC